MTRADIAAVGIGVGTALGTLGVTIGAISEATNDPRWLLAAGLVVAGNAGIMAWLGRFKTEPTIGEERG